VLRNINKILSKVKQVQKVLTNTNTILNRSSRLGQRLANNLDKNGYNSNSGDNKENENIDKTEYEDDTDQDDAKYENENENKKNECRKKYRLPAKKPTIKYYEILIVNTIR
jgi:hypothetical protein